MESVKFAFISDGDIFHFLTLPYLPELDGTIAGMRSGPMVVEIPEHLPEYLGPGWKYLDGEFVNVSVGVTQDPDDYEVE